MKETEGNLTTLETEQKSKKRFWELDFLRGICVILMVFDHIMFTLGYVMPELSAGAQAMWGGFGDWVDDVYWYGGLRMYVRNITLLCFFLICGICCTLSKSNLRRGILCFFVGCGITFVTVIADMMMDLGIAIYFGVLHMLGISMILYGLIDLVGARIKKLGSSDKAKTAARIIGDYLAPTIGLIIIIVYFSCLGHFEKGIIVGNFSIDDKPLSVFTSLFCDVKITNDTYDYIVGGADYWPIFPYAAFVLLGGAIGRAVYNSDKRKNWCARLDGKWNKPICFVGRHAIIVYVLHQVAVFALFYLITIIAT